MSYAAGSGIFVTAVLQDIAQARARWGRDGADMLWSAATCKVVLGGLTGDEPAEISRLAGTYRETLTSHSRLPGGASLSASLSDRPVLTPDAIRTLDPALRQALILHATTPPVITRMVRHHEGPRADDHARAEHDLRAALATLTPTTPTRSRARRHDRHGPTTGGTAMTGGHATAARSPGARPWGEPAPGTPDRTDDGPAARLRPASRASRTPRTTGLPPAPHRRHPAPPGSSAAAGRGPCRRGPPPRPRRAGPGLAGTGRLGDLAARRLRTLGRGTPARMLARPPRPRRRTRRPQGLAHRDLPPPPDGRSDRHVTAPTTDTHRRPGTAVPRGPGTPNYATS